MQVYKAGAIIYGVKNLRGREDYTVFVRPIILRFGVEARDIFHDLYHLCWIEGEFWWIESMTSFGKELTRGPVLL